MDRGVVEKVTHFDIITNKAATRWKRRDLVLAGEPDRSK